VAEFSGVWAYTPNWEQTILLKLGLPDVQYAACEIAQPRPWSRMWRYHVMPITSRSIREAQIMAGQGVIIDRSTLSFWTGYAAAEVAPVVRLRELMAASSRMFGDETVVPGLDPGRGLTKQGYFRAIARNG
jgi:hypothetical protein